MKQYIKKALWIIPFVFSLNLSATTYYFIGSVSAGNYGTATDMGNWNSNSSKSYTSSPSSANGNPTSFSSGDIFDLNGKNVNFAGATLEDITIQNSDLFNSSSFYNNGTVTISSETAPVVSNGAGGQVIDQFHINTSSTVKYDASNSTDQEIMSIRHYNVIMENDNKIVYAGVAFFGSFETTTADIIITFKSPPSFLSSCTFTFASGTVMYFYWAINGSIFSTTQTVKDYPENWIVHYLQLNSSFTSVRPSGSRSITIPEGKYKNLSVNVSDTRLTYLMGGNITITGTLKLSASTKWTGDARFSLNNYTLTTEGTINQSTPTIYLRGSSTSNLTCSTSTNTIFFEQTNGEYRTLKNFTITNGATVNLGNWLDITGGTPTSGFGIVDVRPSSTLNTNAKLTLKSNEYGTAMIGNISGTIQNTSGNNSGTLLVENYIPYFNRGRQYRFLSSPVSGGVFQQWRDSLNNRSGRGIHITGDKTKTKETTGTPTPIDSFDMSTTNHPSAFYYDETNAGSTTGIGTNSGAAEDAGWIRLPQAYNNTIENGKGYRILVRGDRTRWIVSGGTFPDDYDPNNTTIQTRGGYVAGPIDVTITNSGSNANNGINLIGNPYACAIDWNEIYTTCSTTTGSTNVDPVYAVFDPSMQSYQSYSANASTPGPMQYISPGQGFLVYTSSASQKVLFPTSCKVTSDAGARVFSTIKNNHLVTYLRKDSATADRTIIYFIPGATNFYDKYDAGHIQNGNVNLSSLDSSNILYNINCLDSLSSSRIVNLSLYGTPLGTYFMSFEDINTFRNHDVYLIDNYLKKTTKVDENTQYQIDVNTDKFSYAEGRLAISFEPKPLTNLITVNKTDIFNISPNPVKDQLIVKMDNQQIGPIEFEILNVSGQTILSGKLDSPETKINTSNLMTGIYFINLRANNQTQTIKFIK